MKEIGIDFIKPNKRPDIPKQSFEIKKDFIQIDGKEFMISTNGEPYICFITSVYQVKDGFISGKALEQVTTREEKKAKNIHKILKEEVKCGYYINKTKGENENESTPKEEKS